MLVMNTWGIVHLQFQGKIVHVYISAHANDEVH